MNAAERLRKNAILRHLPNAEFDRVASRIEVFDAGIGQPTYEPGGPIIDVYFPLSAVYSLVAVADERIRVEVATVGHEGMVGLPLFLGAISSPQASFCQVPGQSARLSGEDLRRVLQDDGVLHQNLNRLTQAMMVQVAQNVVCNNGHDIQQRAARWLLTTRDRVEDEIFPLTHEFLGQMVGTRRPTVSQVAHRLQEQGLIRYSRGMMQILDRPALEATACECYAVVRREFEAMTRD